VHIPVSAAAAALPAAATTGSLRDLRSALSNLQFTDAAIDAAIGALKAEGIAEGSNLDVLLRRALSHLRGR
jgi:hypothetical protein